VFGETDAIMQPVFASLPELKESGNKPEAAPMGRTGDLAVAETFPKRIK
jgi:hypothetical protein